MFKVQIFVDHRYTTAHSYSRKSLSGAGLAAQSLGNVKANGAFRILSPRGKVVRKGRVVNGVTQFN